MLDGVDAKSGELSIECGLRLVMLAWEGLPPDTQEMIVLLTRDAVLQAPRYKSTLSRYIEVRRLPMSKSSHD